ncbi:RM09 protein, partial [Psilopogon haemacephalus]|nr:RM09 protein [Psilopogon haemacephalus]
QGTVVVERWWKVPLSKEGTAPRLHPRRHRIYRLLQDTKHQPRGQLQLILTRAVDNLGSRGDVVTVTKQLGRNKLLPQGLAVYASPENKKLFEEEKKLHQERKLEVVQTQSGEKTLRFLRGCRLEVGMKNNVQWQLTPQIVARHFLRNVSGGLLGTPDLPRPPWG